ncbi:uncharacterized protein B0I36DRAFT_9943 [Microdochium trichocladiopsis]|uniref:Uncharacterized protein n=1 Tax=Microdochium trichocladiopsis TaxID=1682393 RepID=A0A9P9BVL6_9PEZI|nr:uncharacterized protein B0I36DRAFT_9943 [Microdochium trichocladiopsis]KAH7040408.1 hypothetical protein B0I36DRAFT_9943 [Microdochium trichocladiopsis]
MPIIRSEFVQFVQTWNAHRIRKQPTRTHVIPGRPWSLFFHPEQTGAQDFRLPLDLDLHQKLSMLADLDGFDPDQYLPSTTMAVCQEVLGRIGRLPSQIPPELVNQPFIRQYQYLQEELQVWIRTNRSPAISLLPQPIGNLDYLQDLMQRHHISLQDTWIDMEQAGLDLIKEEDIDFESE